MSDDTRRRALLVAALGFARVQVAYEPPALRAPRGWLGSWSGVGAIAVGMIRQGFDLDLMSLGPGRWQATFLGANPGRRGAGGGGARRGGYGGGGGAACGLAGPRRPMIELDIVTRSERGEDDD